MIIVGFEQVFEKAMIQDLQYTNRLFHFVLET